MATAARLDTLAEIREKVLANERLDFDDGVTLLETDDLTGLGELADTARRLPGGGAEVFADRVRRLVAPGKEHPDNWIATHRAAHGIGMPTHCTMLYGHVENYEERVDHWMRLRDLQDDTGGFLAFVPLPFHP